MVTRPMIENEPKTPGHLFNLPTVNRWVHYMSAGSADGKFPSVCRAMLVTEVPGAGTEQAEKGTVGGCVFNPTGLHFRPLAEGGVPYDPEKGPYSWHWPERG